MPDENVIGTVIGHYKVTAVLNQGGMGAVYRAEHPLIGKPAVIKLLLPDLSSHAEMVHRFFNEAKAASAIRHPGIVEIFDFGYHSDGRAYIVMEFLDGESLAERLIDRGRLPELEAAVLTRSMAGALGAAHAKNIVHRDLKPDNIFLVPDPDMPTGERAKVLDFGIAKLTGDLPTEVSRTRTGAMMGTPLYMAPEQARGAGEVDSRADLYSLGCMLYEMLCGQPPFTAEGSGEIIAMQLFADAVPPREIVPELSEEIERITMGLLEKDPAKRPQAAREVADRLAKALPSLSGKLSAAMPVPATSRMRPVVATPRPNATPASRALTTPAQIPSLPPGASHSQVQATAASARPEPKPTTLGGSAAHMVPSIAPTGGARPAKGIRIVFAAALAIAGAVGAFVLVKSLERGDGGSHATTAATSSTEPATPVEKAPVDKAPVAPTPATPTPATPSTIALTLALDPPAAAVTIDDRPSTLTDGAIAVARDGASHTIVASAPGFVARTMKFKADRDQTLSIALAPAPTAPAPTAPPPTSSPPPPATHPAVPMHGHGAHPPPAHPIRPPAPPHGDGTKPTTPTTSPNGSPIEDTI